LQTVISYEGTKEIISGSRSGFPFRRGDETLGTLISLSLACMGRHVQLTGFVMPEKLGASSTAMSLFETSQAARRLVTFVQSLAAAVRDSKLSDECPTSPLLERLVSTLSTAEGWVKEYPPVQQQFRYGNKAFRCWHSRLCVSSRKLIKDMLPESHHVCVHYSAKVKELCFNPGGLPRI